MQSYRVQVSPDDQLIRLPTEMEVPTLDAGVYALLQPNSQEWTVTLMTPVSAAELERWPELQRLVMHAGGYCAPPLLLPASRHLSPPASRPCHLRVL